MKSNTIQVFPFFILWMLLFTIGLRAEATELYLPFPEILKETSPTNSFDSTLEKNNEATKPQEKETLSKQKINSTSENNTNELKTSVPSVVTNTGTQTKVQKKKKEVVDPSLGSFQKGKSYLARNQKTNAEKEFSDSSNKEGGKSNFARIENTNLFSLDGKDKESNTLVEKVEDPDLKIKAQFEMARSLDRIGTPEAEEKAYKEYLKLINDFPKHESLTPRSHYAVAVMLIRKKEYKPALYHFVTILKDFKESNEFLPSHYHLGKIYESPWMERDLERAQKYYEIYLKLQEGKEVIPGNDFRKETKERLKVLGAFI